MTEEESFRVFITKFALTKGIEERTAYPIASDTDYVEIELQSPALRLQGYRVGIAGEGKNWHRTREGAVARAEELRNKRIASLKHQIKKLEKLKF